jgi:hypothetical protein
LDISEAVGYLTLSGFTLGSVVAKYPRDHQTLSYKYVVSEITYSGQDGIGRDVDFERILVNDELTVYYDPRAHERSLLESPNERLTRNFSGVIFTTLIPSTIFILMVTLLIFVARQIGGHSKWL